MMAAEDLNHAPAGPYGITWIGDGYTEPIVAATAARGGAPNRHIADGTAREAGSGRSADNIYPRLRLNSLLGPLFQQGGADSARDGQLRRCSPASPACRVRRAQLSTRGTHHGGAPA